MLDIEYNTLEKFKYHPSYLSIVNNRGDGGYFNSLLPWLQDQKMLNSFRESVDSIQVDEKDK